MIKKIYNFPKELQFFKDGDQGTNGSTYFCIVRPVDDNGNKIEHFTGLKYYNGIWQKDLALKAFVYHNGEEEYSDVKTFEWIKPNENISISSKDSQITGVFGKGSIDNNGQYYIKLKVKLSNGEFIYYNYPISVIVGEDFEEEEKIKTNIPSLIKYTKSGVKGYYNNDNIYIKYEDIDLDNLESLGALKNKVKINNKKLEIPISFDFSDNSIAAIKARTEIQLDNYIIYPIILYLDTTGNEAIEGWDGTKLPIKNNYSAFAPQVGAGTVDSLGFTGVIMGKDNEQKQIGLYGYCNGTNTFGLKANGAAYFGADANKNRITLDPNGECSMKIGQHFSVTADGKIFSSYGSIGGWQIGNNKIYGASEDVTEDQADDKAYTILNKNGHITTEGITIRDEQKPIGEIGAVEGSNNRGIGIVSNIDEITKTGGVIIIESDNIIRLTAKNYMYFESKNFSFEPVPGTSYSKFHIGDDVIIEGVYATLA